MLMWITKHGNLNQINLKMFLERLFLSPVVDPDQLLHRGIMEPTNLF